MTLLRSIAIIVFLCTQTLLRAQNLPEILFYRFDGTGTAVPNLASNPPVGADTAYLMGGLTQGGTGQCGGGVIGTEVSSTTDYVNTGWATDLSNTSWTIAFWSTNIPVSSTLFYIFGDQSAGSFRCFTNGVAGPNNWILRGTLTDVLLSGGAQLTPTHNAFVYDMTANEIRAYLNGVLVNTVAQTGPVIIGSAFKVVGYSSNVGLSNGGMLDEFRIYSRVLSAAEVTDLVNLRGYDTLSVMTCDSYTSPSGLQTWNTSGTYNDTIPATCGDTVYTINLLVNNSSSVILLTTACGSFISPSNQYVWNVSGTYMDTIPNSIGCDSVIQVNLTINTVDTAVTINIPNLEAQATGAAYQWFDCNTQQLLPGEVNQVFTPVVNGNYAVIVTQNGCTDTSACQSVTFLGNSQMAGKMDVRVYPNPTAGEIMIQWAEDPGQVKVDIINELGETVLQQVQNGTLFRALIPGASGIYFIRLTDAEGKMALMPVVKQ